MRLITANIFLPLKMKLLILISLTVAMSLIIFVGMSWKVFKFDRSRTIYETVLSKAISEQIIFGKKIETSSKVKVPNPSFTTTGEKIFFGNENFDEEIAAEVGQESTYKMKIVVPHQKKFFEWNANNAVLSQKNEADILSLIFKESRHDGVRDLEESGGRWLFAWSYNPTLNYAYIVTIPYEKAFEIKALLINKSIYYGMFVIGLVIIICVLSMNSITARLEILQNHIKDMSHGKFDQHIVVTERDELGQLGEGINQMSQSILSQFEKLKTELTTTREQDLIDQIRKSFIPNQAYLDKEIEITGEYISGHLYHGHWWGVVSYSDWRIIIVADNSGNSVEAALTTASISSFTSTLPKLMNTTPELVFHPKQILSLIPQSGRISCCVASINIHSLQFLYAQNNRLAPLRLNSKREIVPLETDLKHGDSVIFFYHLSDYDIKELTERSEQDPSILEGDISSAFMREISDKNPDKKNDIDIAVVAMKILDDDKIEDA